MKIQQLIFIYYLFITVKTISKNHLCFTEIYFENTIIRNCRNNPIEIEMTRCHGQCYSEDFLIYDWQSEPLPYRHKHSVHCCQPNRNLTRQISIICQNQEEHIISYPFITDCECKLCPDNCDIFK